MQYIYYKSEKGNFGDDLNGWLWPKLFGEENLTDKTNFLGIGSILYNDFPLLKNLDPYSSKIVFGTGVRPTYSPLKIDDKWDIKFLRGPLSSLYTGNRYEYISDAAYALRQTSNFENLLNVSKRYKISLFPYFKSLKYINWAKICNDLGFNYISPESEKGVDFTLREIASSELVITEAMHGAILADILRVPWHRFIMSTPYSEGSMVSEFKWNDWLYSINQYHTVPTHIKFYRKTPINKLLLSLSNNRINAEFLMKSILEKEVRDKLKEVSNFYLSDESEITKIDSKIHNKILTLNEQLSIRI